MKRLSGFIVLLMGIFTLTGMNVYAEDTNWQKDYSYRLDYRLDGSYIRLGTYNGDAAELNVPAKAVINNREYITYISGDYVNAGNSSNSSDNTKTFRMITDWSKDDNLKSLSFEKGVVLDPCLKSLFEACASLEKLDVSAFDTSSVTDMTNMFYKCISLQDLDMSSFDTSNVKVMKNMFFGCTSIKSFDISNFDLKNLDYKENPNPMEGMFVDCHAATSFKLPEGISNIDNRFFYNCGALKYMDIPASVTKIGADAFINTGLRSVTLPNVVKELGDHCLGYTYSSDYEVIPDFVIHADSGSAGYAYAQDNGIEPTCITHDPEVIPGVPATESSTGLTEGKRCKICGEILEAQQVIPKLPHTHTLVTIPAVEPTTKTTGLTQGQKCSGCGKIFKAQKVIPKLSFGLNTSGSDKKNTPSYVLVGKKVPLKINNIKNVKIVKVKWRFKKKKYKKYATLTQDGNSGILKIKKSGKGKTIKVVADITYRYKGSTLTGLFSLHAGSSSNQTAKVSYKIKGTGTEVKSLKIKKTKTVLKIGKTKVLRAVTKPKKVEKNRVSWKSNNKRVATVSSGGKVKAKKRGEAVITCTCPTGRGKTLKASKKIKVR